MLLHAPFRKARFVDDAPEDAFWRILHRLADQAYPALQASLLDALQAVAPRLQREELAALVAAQDVEAVLGLLRQAWSEVATEMLTGEPGERLRRLALDAATRTPMVELSVRFNVQDPQALGAIQAHIGERITAISETTLQHVRRVIERVFASGTPLTQQIQELSALVGLTPRQADSVERFRQGLRDAGLSTERQQRLVLQRIEALKRRRAEAIARTEGLGAAITGQQVRWEQAAREGLIDVLTAKRFFIVTPDDRLCPICAAVPGLNAQGVGLRQPFQTPLGAIVSPPIHVQCRCAVSLRT